MEKQVLPLRIGIVGLGLIGGSAAKAIKEKTGHIVFAYDLDRSVLEKAKSQGCIDGVLDDAVLNSCDMLLLALYPKATIEYVKRHASSIRKGAVVIDFCGVKRILNDVLHALAAENGFIYVGGHPMAGIERSGFDYTKSTLFDGASMILVPDAQLSGEIREQLCGFFCELGFGGVKWSTPEEHDRIIAYTSQLAHVLSSAYVKAPSALSHRGFSAGSFQDMTRVAYLNEDMWTQLFLDNSDYLVQEIEGLAQRLLDYANAIKQRDDSLLREMLREGRERKEQVEKGLI